MRWIHVKYMRRPTIELFDDKFEDITEASRTAILVFLVSFFL